jgi:hypothetical protein
MKDFMDMHAGMRSTVKIAVILSETKRLNVNGRRGLASRAQVT